MTPFAKEAEELQEAITLNEEYEKASTERHTFDTLNGPVTFSAVELKGTGSRGKISGGEKLAAARDLANDQAGYGETPEIRQQGRDTLVQLDRVQILRHRPEVLEQNRKLAVAALLGLVALPFAPIAVGTSAAVSSVISTGFATVPALLPSEDEGWGHISDKESKKIRDAALEGGIFGAAAGGLGGLAFAQLSRLGSLVSKGKSVVKVKGSNGQPRNVRLSDGDPVPPGAEVVMGQVVTRGAHRLSQWTPKQSVNMGTSLSLDLGTSLIPDASGPGENIRG